MNKRYGLSAINEGDHTVEVYWYEGDGDRQVIKLTPTEAFDHAERVMRAAQYAQAQQLQDALRGDCATCSNTRMVKDDRDQVVHCPDCGITPLADLTAAIPNWRKP